MSPVLISVEEYSPMPIFIGLAVSLVLLMAALIAVTRISFSHRRVPIIVLAVGILLLSAGVLCHTGYYSSESSKLHSAAQIERMERELSQRFAVPVELKGQMLSHFSRFPSFYWKGKQADPELTLSYELDGEIYVLPLELKPQKIQGAHRHFELLSRGFPEVPNKPGPAIRPLTSDRLIPTERKFRNE